MSIPSTLAQLDDRELHTRALDLHQLYYGNVLPQRGGMSGGLSLLAASEGAEDWAVFCSKNTLLGDVGHFGPLWLSLPAFEGFGLFSLNDRGAVIAQLQKIPSDIGDPRSPHLYRWILLTLDDVIALGGNWELVFRHFEPDNGEWLLGLPSGQFKPIGPLVVPSLTAQQFDQYLAQSVQAAEHYFRGHEETLRVLLASLFDNGGPVAIKYFPDDPAQRLEFTRALGALLPPVLRVLCTFSTRQIETVQCNVHFKLLMPDQTSNSNDDRLFNWANQAFERGQISTFHPYVERAVREFSAGNLLAFIKAWDARSARILDHTRDVKSTCDHLINWIDYHDNFTLEQAFNLLETDPSIGIQERHAELNRILEVMYRDHQWSNYSRNLYNQLAKHPDLAATFEAGIDKYAYTDTGLELLAALQTWDRRDQRLIPWLCRAASHYNRCVCQNGNTQAAHEFLKWIQHYRRAFDLSSITGSVLGQQQAFAARYYTRDTTGHAVLLLLASAEVLPARELGESFQTHGWIKALPVELAEVLRGLSDQPIPPGAPGGLWSAVEKYYVAGDREDIFFKLALILDVQRGWPALDDPHTMQQLLLFERSASPQTVQREQMLARVAFNDQERASIAFMLLDALYSIQDSVTPNTIWMLFVWSLKYYFSRDTRYAQRSQGLFSVLRGSGESAPSMVKHFSELDSYFSGNDSRHSVVRAFWHVARDTADLALSDYNYALLVQYPWPWWYHIEPAVLEALTALNLEQPYQYDRIDKIWWDLRLYDKVAQWLVSLLPGFLSGDPAVRLPVDDLVTQLAGWWLKQVALSIMESPPNVANAVDLTQSAVESWEQNTYLTQCFHQGLYKQMMKYPSETLSEFRKTAEKRKLTTESNLAHTAFTVRLIVPGGNFRAFYELVIRANELLRRLRTLQDEGRNIQKVLDLIALDQEIARLAEELTVEERDQLSKACAELGTNIDRLGWGYDRRERGAFFPSFADFRGRVHRNLIKGKRKPKSPVGLLKRLSGIVAPRTPAPPPEPVQPPKPAQKQVRAAQPRASKPRDRSS